MAGDVYYMDSSDSGLLFSIYRELRSGKAQMVPTLFLVSMDRAAADDHPGLYK